jgi:hypothetical protein
MSKMNSHYQDEEQRKFDEAVQERIDRAIEKIEAVNLSETMGDFGEGYNAGINRAITILKGEGVCGF